MGVIVVVCVAFGLTLSAAKTEIVCCSTKRMLEETTIFSVDATGQMYHQTNEFVNMGEPQPQQHRRSPSLSIEVDRPIRNAWCSFQKYTLELYDRPSAPLELKFRMLIAGVLETTLYGYVTWSTRACHYDTLRRAHYSFLIRCISRRENSCTDLPISCLDILMTGSDSVDAIIRGRRMILFAFFLARIDTRLPNCVMFGR